MDLRAEMVAALIEVAKECGNQFDIVDGADGTPAPNWAMRLHSQIEYALDHQHPLDLEQACIDALDEFAPMTGMERRDNEVRLNKAALLVARLSNVVRQYEELDAMERAERMAEERVAAAEWEADLRNDIAREGK